MLHEVIIQFVTLQIVSFLNYHVNNPMDEIEKPLRAANLSSILKPWDATFVEMDQMLLFDVIQVSEGVVVRFLAKIRTRLGCELHGHKTSLGLMLCQSGEYDQRQDTRTNTSSVRNCQRFYP